MPPTSETSDDRSSSGELIQKAVEALAISQEDARALVDKYWRRYSSSGRPGSERDHATRMRIARAIVARYAKFAAISGGVTSLPGVIPGIGTVAAVLGGGLADVVAALKIQVDMCVCLVELFEDDLVAEDRRQLAVYLALTGAIEKVTKDAATPLVTKAFVRMAYRYLTGPTLVLVRQLFARVGIVFTQKALVKAIPFGVSVVVSSGTNFALTKFIGGRLISFFDVKADMERAGESLTDE